MSEKRLVCNWFEPVWTITGSDQSWNWKKTNKTNMDWS